MAVKKIPETSYLRINDIEFEVPPMAIGISKQDNNFDLPTLRTPIPTKVKSGRREILIDVDLFFSTGANARLIEQKEVTSWVNAQLAPLLIQIRKNPFVSIENEKIRKEILGEGLVADKRNIAATVKQVQITGDVRKSEFISVKLIMKLFNHHPFTPDFKFREKVGDDFISQDVPGSLFEKYYRSGTIDDSGRFINSIDSLEQGGSGLEIIYKQYYQIDLEALSLQEILSQISDVSEIEREDYKDAFNTEVAIPFDPVRAKQDVLENLGWVFEDSSKDKRQNSRIIYRYKKFTISNNIGLESDALIVESVVASLETLTPDIPLQSHSIPTSQFLGCANGHMSFQIFANAQLEKDGGTREEIPVGTSRELSKLNKIVEVTNQNALMFNRHSRNDSIFIKNPVANLLKYKYYTNFKNNNYLVLNGRTGELEVFDPNEYLACIVENTNSRTVPGHPFCSRFIITMSENYRNEETVQVQREGGSNRVKEAIKKSLNTLATRFGIVKQGGRFVSTTTPLAVRQKEVAISQKMIASLNTSLEIKDFETVTQLLNDPDFTEVSPNVIKRQLAQARIGNVTTNLDELRRQNPNATSLRELGINTNPYAGAEPMSAKRINEIGNDIIILVDASDTKEFSDYDESMEVFSSYNLVRNDSAYPDVNLPLDESNPDFYYYNLSDELNTEEQRKRFKEGVYEDRLATGQLMADLFQAKDAPIPLRDAGFRGSNWVPSPATNALANNGAQTSIKADTDKIFTQQPTNANQQQILVNRDIENFADDVYRMRRAMPTFKLYLRDEIIENEGTFETSTEGEWRSFDDFYDTNAVIDIRVARDEENPVDVMIVRLTNTRGSIINSSFLEDGKPSKRKNLASASERNKNAIAKTADEGRLDGVILKEGTRVQLRLGYDNNPNNLEVEFSGRIANVGGGDIVEIMCQGDGVELVQELKGVGSTSDDFQLDSDTAENITDLLKQSREVQSFGSTGTSTILGDVDFLWKRFGGRSVIENIFAPTLYNTFSDFGDDTLSYAGWGAAIGTAFLGLTIPGAIVGGAIGAAKDVYDEVDKFLNGATFNVYEQTIWEVLQEMTLRHPGTICYPVPFDGRSTLFFGYPEQLYFFRGPTYLENSRIDDTRNFGVINKTRRDILVGKLGSSNISSLKSQEEITSLIGRDNQSSSGLSADAMRAFRKYHLITSQHDIVSNEMMVTSDNVYNAIQVVHPDSRSDSNFDGSQGFSGYTEADTIKADDDLNPRYIKKQTLVFHNAAPGVVKDMPERYAIGALCKSLEGVYKGKITILGKPGIKPHDVVFIEDVYNQISGAVKVSKVTQVFSYRTGWLTEIHPAMLVSPAGAVTLDQVNAMKRAAKGLAFRNMEIFNSGFVLDEVDDRDKALLTRANNALGSQGQAVVNTAYDIGLTTATMAVARRNLPALPRATADAFKAGQAAKSGSNLANLSRGALSGGKVVLKGVGKVSTVPILGMLLDYGVTRYISWSKTRQPISFLPVHRECKPWYTALHGIKNNTEFQAITEGFLEDVGYLADYVKEKISGD